MATVRKHQNNFTTGAISPAVYSRTDLQKYGSGCKRIVNAVVHAHGGVSNRPGTLLVDELPGPGLLFPFTYSVSQTYVLAFFDPDPSDTGPHFSKMRILKGGGVVTDPEGLVAEVETPYYPEDLAGLRFVQSADTMFIAHPKHPPKKLVRSDHHVWTFSDLVFVPAILPPTGITATLVGFGGDAVPGFSMMDEVPTPVSYKVASVDSRGVESAPSAACVTTVWGWPRGGRVDLTWTAVAGATRYEVYKNVNGFYAWIGSADTTLFKDTNMHGDPGTGPKENRDPFTPPPTPTNLVLIVGIADSNDEVRVSAVSPGGVESAASEAAVSTKRMTSVRWNRVLRAASYNVYRRIDGGAWQYKAVPDPGTGTTVNTSLLGTGWSLGNPPETGSGNYPGVVGIYQQRLVLGRTNGEPQTVWMSETGAFDSMAVATPLRADSSITATVDSRQMNEIRHFVPLRDVLMFTSGAEFLMSAGRNSDAITPTSISFNIQSYWGASEVPPVVSGSSVIFVGNSGLQVRDIRYQLNDDGYSGEDVSILASHLLDSPVVDWAYQQSPWSTIWICLASGKLLTFTYMREQEIWAWSEHESSGGKFRSVSSIREGEEDYVYYLVERGGKYFVEFQNRRRQGEGLADAYFVDCGLRYDDPENPISHVTGLDHLAGEGVVALADGAVIRGLTVAQDGSVDLPEAAGKISIGLPYTTTVETLDPELRAEDGDTLGRKKVVPVVVFNVLETRGLYAGPTEDALVPVKFPPPALWGVAPGLYSGVLEVTIPGVHRTEASIVFQQQDPLPMTVLSVATQVGVG